ncbi:hypothetical protein [Cohaesibacter celericrescens]|uniref:hypothetical protein n=1 Tax=Cohaesibacter celericrescens TaxID=2067669 RepID=UPI003568C2EA
MFNYSRLPFILVMGIAFPLSLTDVKAVEPMKSLAPTSSITPHKMQPTDFNHLNKFRKLQPPKRLIFPPIMPSDRLKATKDNPKKADTSKVKWPLMTR